LVGDAGGKAPALAKGVFGADNVARVLASTFPLFLGAGAMVKPCDVNGQPGAILRDRDGKVVGTVTLDVLGGRIQTIRSVVNPDKLGHLGPLADAWAVAREVKNARRSNN
jgi:RNA polymerase sigma-70 factor (ECF subfamily)